MAEYIERDAAKKLIDNACAECREACEEFDGFYADCNQCLLHGVKNKLPHLPAADVRPVARGRWKPHKTKTGKNWWKCSACDYVSEHKAHHNYCPNCGAEMREES